MRWKRVKKTAQWAVFSVSGGALQRGAVISRQRNGIPPGTPLLLNKPHAGFEPMRWKRVKKTAQWAVFSVSGGALQRGAVISRQRNGIPPGTPLLFEHHPRSRFRFRSGRFEAPGASPARPFASTGCACGNVAARRGASGRGGNRLSWRAPTSVLASIASRACRPVPPSA